MELVEKKQTRFIRLQLPETLYLQIKAEALRSYSSVTAVIRNTLLDYYQPEKKDTDGSKAA